MLHLLIGGCQVLGNGNGAIARLALAVGQFLGPDIVYLGIDSQKRVVIKTPARAGVLVVPLTREAFFGLPSHTVEAPADRSARPL